MDSYNNEVSIDGGNLVTQNESIPSQSDRRYAGFWMRFWAYIVDGIIIFSINGFLLSPFKFLNNGAIVQFGYWTVNGFAAAIIFYVYFLLMTKFFGQTLGKMIFGLKVVSEKEESLTWTDLFFREVVGRFIYNIIGILAVLYVVVAFTKEKQGIHDFIGKTHVIHVD